MCNSTKYFYWPCCVNVILEFCRLLFDLVFKNCTFKCQQFYFYFFRAFSIHSQACEAGLSETQMQLQKLNPDGDDDNGLKTKNILISANDYLNFSDTKTLNSKNSSYAQTLSSEETVYLL